MLVTMSFTVITSMEKSSYPSMYVYYECRVCLGAGKVFFGRGGGGVLFIILQTHLTKNIREPYLDWPP